MSLTFAFYHEAQPIRAGSLRSGALGGTESSIAQVALGLASRGHRVWVFGPGLDAPERLGEDDCWLYPIRDCDGLLALGLVDVLVGVRTSRCFATYAPVRARLLWVHDICSRPAWLLEALAKVQRVVYVSEWQRRSYEHLVEAANGLGAVVPNPLGFAPPSQQVQFDDRALRCVFLSRPERGLDLLLALWPELRERVPGAELLVAHYRLAGEPARQLPQMAGVTHHSGANKAELQEVLSRARLLLYPTEFPETFCLAVRESAACGVPCVTFDHGALKETVAGGGVVLPSFLGSPGSRESFLAAAERLLTLEEAWKRRSIEAVEVAGASDPATVAAQWERLGHDCIAEMAEAVGPTPALDRRWWQELIGQVREEIPATSGVLSMESELDAILERGEASESSVGVLFDGHGAGGRFSFRALEPLLDESASKLWYRVVAEGCAGIGAGVAVLEGAALARVSRAREKYAVVPRATICACLIVDALRSHLHVAIDSIRTFVDEIVLIYTGTAERDLEVARRLLEGVGVPYKVAVAPWQRSFAAARNVATDLTECTWLFWLDDDEQLVGGDALRSAVQNPGLDGVSIPQVSSYIHGDRPTIQMPVRLVRREADVTWVGQVHEILENRGGGVPKSVGVVRTAALHHVGYLDAGLRRRKFHGRNSELLWAQLLAQPERPRSVSLWLRGRVNVALEEKETRGALSQGVHSELSVAIEQFSAAVVKPGHWLEYLLVADFVSSGLELLDIGVSFEARLAVGVARAGVPVSQAQGLSLPESGRLPTDDDVRRFLHWLVDLTVKPVRALRSFVDLDTGGESTFPAKEPAHLALNPMSALPIK